jgi:hypothetical protein
MGPTNSHWRRDEPTFYNFLALDRRPLDAPEFLCGLRGALMSRDTKSGSATFVCEIPPGFRGRTDAQTASLEIFVLRGDLAFNGQSIGASGYLHLPQLCGGGEVASHSGALAPAGVLPRAVRLAQRRGNPRAHGWPDGLPVATATLPSGALPVRTVPRRNPLGCSNGACGLGRSSVVESAGGLRRVPKLACDAWRSGMGWSGSVEQGAIHAWTTRHD